MSEYIPEISEELMAGFFDEAPDYLETLDDGLMAFEDKINSGSFSLEDEEDQTRMNEMFRAAHSLKGLGAALGFDKIRDLTHLMETLFDHVRMGKRSLDQDAFETLFGVFDKLKELIKELAEPPNQPVSIEESLAKLEAVLSSPAEPRTTALRGQQSDETAAARVDEAAAATPSSDEAQAAQREADPPAVSSPSEVLDDPALAQLFAETTLESLDQLNQALLKLEDATGDLDLINSVFRCAHNIKGATGMAGCTAIYHLTHEMETALDLVRAGKLELDPPLMQAVFGVVDRVRTDIELIRAGRTNELSSEGTVGIFSAWLGEAESTQPDPKKEKEEISPAQPRAQDDASSNGRVRVTVTFAKDFVEAEIQAYLIHNKLRELGDILESIPDIDAMDGSSSLEEITFLVQTTVAAEELQKLISSYAVQSVSASGAGAEQVSGEKSSSPASQSAAQDASVRAATPGPSSGSKAQVSSLAQTPQSVPATSGKPAKSPPAAANKKKTPARVGETIRVDLERLDQLMNLGGELVINKARLTQIHGRFDPLFQGQGLSFVVDDMIDRVARLDEGLAELTPSASDARRIRDLSETVLHLSHDFDAIRGLVESVKDGRGIMNDFSEALHALSRVSEGMQTRIMETRMVAVGPLFQRFRRVVRDIARSNGKTVELILRGEATELDKRMIDELGDPLTHMIRNSVDHGLETPEERVRAGKPEIGQVTLEAYHRGRHICIEVRDDGRGVNIEAVKRKIVEKELATEAEVERMTEKEIIQYVFRPGFSTAQKVTDLSGRGMGMDIVINKLEGINGTVDIESETGKGSTVTIKLPLTLAIITSIVAQIGRSVYAVPLDAVAEIITVSQSTIQYVQKKPVVRVRDRVIPIAFFEQIYSTKVPDLLTVSRDHPSLTLVILEMQEESIGLVVDELIGQEDVVIKSIAENYRNVAGITGASIMGDGTVALILDVASMMSMFAASGEQVVDAGPAETETPADTKYAPKEVLADACAD